MRAIYLSRDNGTKWDVIITPGMAPKDVPDKYWQAIRPYVHSREKAQEMTSYPTFICSCEDVTMARMIIDLLNSILGVLPTPVEDVA